MKNPEPRFPEGTRVRVKEHIDAPEWATYGTVVSNPGPNSNYYLHPLVKWDSDGKQRNVPDSWLERTRTRDRNYIAARCSCGRAMRMGLTVLRAAPVICGKCGTEFKETS